MHYDDEKAPNTIDEGVNRIIECILVEFLEGEEYLEYPNCCYVNWNDAQKKRYIKSGEKKAFYFQRPKKQWSTARRKFRTLGKREIAELEL